jgi:hypothetical protein
MAERERAGLAMAASLDKGRHHNILLFCPVLGEKRA